MSTSPRRLGKYELLERLGRGGMAEVWKAIDTQLRRYVAIKLLHANLRDDPNFIARFRREAQLIASLRHPNIVQIHDFQIYRAPEYSAGALDERADTPTRSTTTIAYMVMDYVEGQTLADYIHNTSRKGQIPSPEDIVRLFASISLAIDYAHQKGMIHRDIKPANILLDRRNTTRNPMGEPILTDFGIAKLLGPSTHTQSGAQPGTPYYASPEQARGYAGNEWSDIYSLGVILYELVTGVTPFRGNTPIDVLTQHMNAAPTSPVLINPNVPPALTLVIMRSLAKDPAARFPSASSLTAAVAEALNVSVPEILGQPTYPADPLDMPTYLTPLNFTPAATPGAPMPSLTAPGPSSPLSSPARPLTPIVNPLGSTPSSPSPTAVPTSFVPALSPTPPPPMQRRWLYPALATLLLVVVVASGLGAYFLYFRNPFAPAYTAVGQAFFVSSGQLDPTSASGVADRLQIDLQNIPDPASGKSYYLWLMGDKNPLAATDLVGPPPIHVPLLLTNNLAVHNSTVHFTYAGDAHHDDLLSVGSRLLITEEDALLKPSEPSSDHTTWKYYAELPQAPIPLDANHFSALIHIRHLFYNETNIQVLGLPGGLDIWFFRNTEKILEWAISARDYWHGLATSTGDINLMHPQFVRILDYLDGSPNLSVDGNIQLYTDPTTAQVALLTVDPQHQQGGRNPPGYTDHTQFHVSQISKATDITPAMHTLTAQIIEAINNTKTWLLNVHKDDLALFNMSPTQLQQPETGTLLDDLVTQATYAYIGQLDPVTNQVHPGILQAHYDIQQLATFTLTTHVPASL
jgi:eukaryotic-like serine/threonine-protein kinase